MGQSRSGDKGAFGTLTERYQPMARRIAAGLVGDGDTAQELAQEAMLQAYLSLDRLRDGHCFQSWLYGIVLTVRRGHLRHRETSLLWLESLPGDVQLEAMPFAPASSTRRRRRRPRSYTGRSSGPLALSVKNRAATLMFYYYQLSVREIAATVGVSVAAVKGRLHRSRSRLGELLLPTYADVAGPASFNQEDRTMVKVTISDLASREGKHPITGKITKQQVIILLDKEGGRVLPIWISPNQGEVIALGLKDYSAPHPLTYTFMANVIDAIGDKSEEGRVEELKEDTFYAVVKLRRCKSVREIDARPSDAIALAVQTGSPLYAAEEVFEKVGVKLEGEMGDKDLLRKGLENILSSMEEGAKERMDAKWSSMTEGERRRARVKMAQVSDFAFVCGHCGER